MGSDGCRPSQALCLHYRAAHAPPQLVAVARVPSVFPAAGGGDNVRNNTDDRGVVLGSAGEQGFGRVEDGALLT
jgi:hypothetical protein